MTTLPNLYRYSTHDPTTQMPASDEDEGMCYGKLKVVLSTALDFIPTSIQWEETDGLVPKKDTERLTLLV